MTLEQIEQATGRDLDWLCAQHIFGYSNRRIGAFDYDFVTLPDGKTSCHCSNVPKYSADWNSMALLLKRMRENAWEINVSTRDNGKFHAEFFRWNDKTNNIEAEAFCIAENLPVSVCKAALKAILAQKASA